MRTEDAVRGFKAALAVDQQAIAPKYSDSLFQLCWMAIIAAVIGWLRKTRTYKYFRLVEDEAVINWVLGESDRS
jgi:cell division protein FtsX